MMSLNTGWVRRIWRKLLQIRYRGERRRSEQGIVRKPRLELVHGRPIVVIPQVFNPRLLRSGAFFAGSFDRKLIPEGSRVLDMGTGSGVGAVFASQWASEVVAVDINPEAVRCARINALLHRLETRVEVRQGDLFAPVLGERFDVVLFNPPYFHGEPEDDRERAFWSTGLDARFAEGLGDHLTPTGHALLCLSTDADTGFVEELERAGFSTDLVAERDLINEVLRLYRVSRS